MSYDFRMAHFMSKLNMMTISMDMKMKMKMNILVAMVVMVKLKFAECQNLYNCVHRSA